MDKQWDVSWLFWEEIDHDVMTLQCTNQWSYALFALTHLPLKSWSPMLLLCSLLCGESTSHWRIHYASAFFHWCIFLIMDLHCSTSFRVINQIQVQVWFPSQGLSMQSSDAFFVVSLSKQMSKKWELLLIWDAMMLMWCHCNVIIVRKYHVVPSHHSQLSPWFITNIP